MYGLRAILQQILICCSKKLTFGFSIIKFRLA